METREATRGFLLFLFIGFFRFYAPGCGTEGWRGLGGEGGYRIPILYPGYKIVFLYMYIYIYIVKSQQFILLEPSIYLLKLLLGNI